MRQINVWRCFANSSQGKGVIYPDKPVCVQTVCGGG